MAGLNSQYVTSLSLEEYFVSNQSALALAGGQLFFYVDSNRTQAKDIFQLVQGSGSPPNYTYQPLPNPLRLSNSGTIVDSNGNNVSIYYYPFDQFGNEQLYYVECYDFYDNLQFTREAWPFPNGSESGGSSSSTSVGIANQLTNPQFSKVLFNPIAGLTISLVGTATTVVPVAPGWTLSVTHSNAGSVTVNQVPVAGSSAYPGNPPFTLNISGSATVTGMSLIQTLNNNPDWAAPQVAGQMGYIASSILLGPDTSVTVQYKPSNGNPVQTLLNVTNTTGSYAQSEATVQLLPAANPDTGVTGSDQIIINLLNTTSNSSISNVQIVPLTTNTSGVQYDQTPVNRQVDQMFNYYNPLIQSKPIPSYLVGWDFPLAPFQTIGTTGGPYATGANSAVYINDTTIVFQSASNAFTFAQDASGALTLNAQVNAQLAIIQYIPANNARSLMYENLCSMVQAYSNVSGGLPICVSLWATDNGSLPSTVVSNTCFVTSLDSRGHPNVVASGWTEVPQLYEFGTGLGTTTVTNTGAQSSVLTFNDYPFANWNASTLSALQSTATYFAIVVGTAQIAGGKLLKVNSISLQQGSIPTHPAAMSLGEVLAICQQYYEKSFALSTVPAQNVGVNTGEFIFNNIVGGSALQSSGSIQYKVNKYVIPSVSGLVLYNPSAANAQVRNETIAADCISTAIASSSVNSFALNTNAGTGIGAVVGDRLGIHWSSDARLGY